MESNRDNVSPKGEAPIFVAGIAGTGKTPLAKLLNNHPRIVITRRTYMWRRFYEAFGDLSEDANFERCLTGLLATPGIQALEPEPDRLRAEFSSGPKTYGELFALIHRHHAQAVGKVRWGDQLGLAEGHADSIFAAYPSAAMIHMVRDPRAARIAGRQPGLLGWSIGKWATSAELAVRNRRVHGARYLVVRYEELSSDPVGTLAAVCSFLDEEFDAAVAGAAETWDGTVESDRGAVPDSVGAGARRFIENCTADLMATHGYNRSEPAPKPGIRYTLLDWPANSVTMGAWKRLRGRRITNNPGE